MSGHKHAALMLQYAQDAAETDKPWERWEYDGGRGWLECGCGIGWYNENEYRRKPKTININGFEVPEPVREPLNFGDEYYYTISLFKSNWTNDAIDARWLELGLIHRTNEAAQSHLDALLSFTRTDK